MLSKGGTDSTKPSIEDGSNNGGVLQDQKQRQRQRQTDFKLLRMTQALSGVIGAALVFTIWFADFAAPLNISNGVMTISLLILGGTVGYYAFLMSKHK